MKSGLRALTALLLLSATAAQAPSQEPTVRLVTMPRDGKGPFARSVSVVRALDDELLKDWRDAKEEARAAAAQVIILEVTATAGRRNVLTAMAEDFADLRASGIKVVVFVPEKA